MLYLPCRTRLEDVDFNPHAELAPGLAFCGAAALRGADFYHDLSLHGNCGTLTNYADPSAAWAWSDVAQRYMLVGDGTNDRVDMSRPIDVANRDVSFSAWLYLAALPSAPKYLMHFNRVGEAYGTFWYIHTYNALSVWIPGSGGDAVCNGPEMLTGTHHVCTVVPAGAYADMSLVRFYLDGVYSAPVATTNKVGAATATLGTFSLLGRESADDRNLAGRIGDPLVYLDRLLSDAEVQQLADRSNHMLSDVLVPRQELLVMPEYVGHPAVKRMGGIQFSGGQHPANQCRW